MKKIKDIRAFKKYKISYLIITLDGIIDDVHAQEIGEVASGDGFGFSMLRDRRKNTTTLAFTAESIQNVLNSVSEWLKWQD